MDNLVEQRKAEQASYSLDTKGLDLFSRLILASDEDEKHTLSSEEVVSEFDVIH